MAQDELDLAYRVLDLDLVDCDGTRCGKVDDLELTGEPGETAYVGAIVSGPGALGRRFPRRLRRFGNRIFGGGATRIEWADVGEIERGAVKLERPAAELGLGEGDRAVIAALRRLGG